MGGALTTAQFDLVPPAVHGRPWPGCHHKLQNALRSGGWWVWPTLLQPADFPPSVPAFLQLEAPCLCFNCDKIHITQSLLFHPLLNAQFSGIQLATVCGMCPLLCGHHHHLSPEPFSSCRTDTVYP